jgi:hypothetical protein
MIRRCKDNVGVKENGYRTEDRTGNPLRFAFVDGYAKISPRDSGLFLRIVHGIRHRRQCLRGMDEGDLFILPEVRGRSLPTVG